MIAHSFSYRMGTHTSQCPPANVESKAFNFMRFMCVIVSGGHRDRHFVIYMDQTPVYFTMNSKGTLEVIGEKTIHICRSRSQRTVRYSCLPMSSRGSRMAALQQRSSHLAITQQPTFTSARKLPEWTRR
jgi:hypothetical protein